MLSRHGMRGRVYYTLLATSGWWFLHWTSLICRCVQTAQAACAECDFYAVQYHWLT